MTQHLHSSLAMTEHRPWPLPATPWVWRQTWTDLAFLHWRIPAGTLRPFVPAGLEIDTFDGSAWLGLVPFELSDFSVRRWPAVPWLSRFLETNLRTYVTDGHQAGVWFFRLDATRALAVLGARIGLGLPYVWSRMAMTHSTGVDYQVHRGRAALDVSYAASGEAFAAPEDPLASFLTERYCLYAMHLGRLVRLEIHHRPWRLHAGTATIRRNSIPEAEGLPSMTGSPLVHIAARQDVIGWLPTPVSGMAFSDRRNASSRLHQK